MAGSCCVVRHNRVCGNPCVTQNTDEVNSIEARDAKYSIVDELVTEISSHTQPFPRTEKHHNMQVIP